MIKVGTKLTLEYEKKEEEVTRYRCRVVEQKGANLYIDYPINTKTGRADFFPNGTFLFAYFVGKDEAVYKFYTEIIGRKRDKIPMLVIRYDQNKLQKIQRREFVRVDANLDIALSDPDGQVESFTTVTKDISGGGLATVLPDDIEIEPQTRLDITLVLRSKDEDVHYIFATAETIRMQKKVDNSKNILSLKFIDILESDRQHIIQFCFETQLKERKRSLL